MSSEMWLEQGVEGKYGQIVECLDNRLKGLHITA